MTNTKSIEELSTDILRSALAENSKSLAAVRADVDLYKRLVAAGNEEQRLVREGQELTEALSKAQAKEDAQAKDERKAAYRNLSVTTSYGSNAGGTDTGAHKAVFTIRWEQPTFDMNTRQSEWVARSQSGFEALDIRVYQYLMEFRTDAIPAVIMELAPADPQAAMEKYFVARRRGWM